MLKLLNKMFWVILGSSCVFYAFEESMDAQHRFFLVCGTIIFSMWMMDGYPKENKK